MLLIPPSAARRVPWKNGLGSTLEIATDAAAPGGDWTWRLSIADVPARAPFSTFPGIDRHIACLSGIGLAIEIAGDRRTVPNEGVALAFRGEDAATGEPLAPEVRDINLMVRRERWTGRLTLARGRGLELDAPLVVLHAPEGSAILRVKTTEGPIDLLPDHTLVTAGRVTVAGASGSVAAACEISPSRRK